MSNAPRDNNRVPTILGVSSIDLETPTRIAANPSTGAMLIDGPSLYAGLDPRYVNVTGDTMQGDLDFAGYKAIAMACDNGATLPTSPITGQWFLHTPTGRSVLMQYVGGAWIPIFNFGTTTLYVDPTGTDSENNGFGTGTDAYLTPTYAFSKIAPFYSGNVTINLAAGVYTNIALGLRTPTGNFAITINGEMTTLESGTATSGVSGLTSTRASLTDTSKAWTTDQWKGKYLYWGSQAQVIVSNTSDTIYMAASAHGTPTGDYTIQESLTQVTQVGSSCVTTQNAQGVTFTGFRFTEVSGQSIWTSTGTSAAPQSVSFTRCFFEHNFGSGPMFSLSTVTGLLNCYVQVGGAATLPAILTGQTNSRLTLTENLFSWTGSGRGSAGISLSMGQLTASFSNTFENLTTAISTVQSFVTINQNTVTGYNFYTNCGTGVDVSTGSIISGQPTNGVFTNCGTNLIGSWSAPETTIFGISGNNDVFKINSLAGNRATFNKDGKLFLKGSLTVNDNTKLGEVSATYFGDGEFIDNVVHRADSFIEPLNAHIGCIWVDEN